jgi:hypothetical protein
MWKSRQWLALIGGIEKLSISIRYFYVHLAKKCRLSSPVFNPRLRLGQKTQTRMKKVHFLHNYVFATEALLVLNYFLNDC